MRRRSSTNARHDPFELLLDEGISGARLAGLLKQGGVPNRLYSSVLKMNKGITDEIVIQKAAKNNLVILTRDSSMKSDWIQHILKHKAKVIVLSDDEGTVFRWAGAVAVSQEKWTRILLDHMDGPVVMHLDRFGDITKVMSSYSLDAYCKKLTTTRVVRAKKRPDAP